MPFTPQHFGLYFTEAHVRQARKERSREPFKSAWAYLSRQPQEDDLAGMMADGLRWRFEGDSEAGARAVAQLCQPYDPDAVFLDRLAVTMMLAHGFEMARDHPAFGGQEAWLAAFFERVSQLNQPNDRMSYVEYVHLAALNAAAGVVLEREDIFEMGAGAYRQIIRDDVRPEGYIPRAVSDDAHKGDGQNLQRQLLAVRALVLTAEAASHAGVNLWAYEYRGVSVITAASYLLYYYYYPDQWRWDSGLQEHEVKALFRQHGGFLEMVNAYAQLKTIRLMLDELRPLDDPSGGGLTTLTHGVPKRGLFG